MIKKRKSIFGSYEIHCVNKTTCVVKKDLIVENEKGLLCCKNI